MNDETFERARKYAAERLEKELPPDLYYHGYTHTRDDVVPAVERLAKMEGVNGKSLRLLLTGAWYHDLGFIEQGVHHELIGARIAVQVLPGFGYSEEDAETVRWIILATALPQSPNNLLEEIMADADLDVLGRKDFTSRNEALRREIASHGRTFTDQEWYSSQIKFLETHNYFTASARKLRNEQKRVNLDGMKKILEKLNTKGHS